jgi:uncharacterized membrane protein
MIEPGSRELLDLALRWVHLVAGIMWIGNSLLFNWLDRNLERDAGAGDRHLGRIWLLHSGGFYDVEKKLLAAGEMPRVLHWFKWQAYTTWATGLLLLVVLYWTGGSTLMIDPRIARLQPWQAASIGVGAVVGAWLVYDGVWRVLGRYAWASVSLSLAVGLGAVWGLTHVLSGRAAFIHVGAMLGTCMAGNVAMHIVPSQRRLVAATRQGHAPGGGPLSSPSGTQRADDATHAKQRSIHNNYMTFPLLFTMLSNHFSLVTANQASWLLLAILFAGGALVRHWLNIRFVFRGWIPALAATIAGSLGAVGLLALRPTAVDAARASGGPPVAFSTVRFILHERCTPCHADSPRMASNPLAPRGVRFDTTDEVAVWRERIQARAVVTRTMPLNNLTAMTDEERETLARWFMQGAPMR